MLVTAIALFFSTFTSTILSILFTSGIYVIGHLLEDLKKFGEKSDSVFIKKSAEFIYYALPNMDFHNLKPNVTYDIPVEPSMILWVTFYTLAYIILLLWFSTIIFHRREFK
jgi:ABC-type transport system involved in multi-copper enzyme maturation permease subunit